MVSFRCALQGIDPVTVNHNLACGVHRRAISNANAIALSCREQCLTYAELASHAAKLAALLKQRCATRRDDAQPPRVGILASRSIGACIAALGAAWAGVTYVPFGLKQPQDRLAQMISQCQLSALIVDAEGARLLGERLPANWPSLVVCAEPQAPAPEHARRGIIDLVSLPEQAIAEPVHVAASDIAYIIFTSGSTGMPKGVMVPAGAFRHYVKAVNETLGMRADDRVLGISELSFDVSAHNMFATWEAGAALHLLPAAATFNAVKFARTSKLTVWNSVPSLAGMLHQMKALAPDSLSCLRLTAFGGEPLPVSVLTAWRRAAPHSEIFNVYGPTEVTVGCVAQRIVDPFPVTPQRDVIAIGQPFAGTEACIADEHGMALPDGSSGELLLSGAQLAAGYLNDAAMTAARFPVIDGKRWYRSGDLAMRDADGRLHCLGRLDNQVKVLGHRIELDEVDAHLRIASGIDLVSAVAWPRIDGVAQGIVAFIGAAELNDFDLMRALKARLPAYMAPHRIIALPEMPLNASGKVDRLALLRLLESEAA
jgi:amino acid adenylation domain-containing protein